MFVFLNHCSLRSKRFRASSSRKLGREQNKKGMTGEGEGTPVFCSCSNFRATTRLETLATQAKITAALWLSRCSASWLGSLPRSWNSHMIVGFCRDTATVCSLSINETHQTQVKLPAFVLPEEKKHQTAYVVSFVGNHFIKISRLRFPEDHVR